MTSDLYIHGCGFSVTVAVLPWHGSKSADVIRIQELITDVTDANLFALSDFFWLLTLIPFRQFSLHGPLFYGKLYRRWLFPRQRARSFSGTLRVTLSLLLHGAGLMRRESGSKTAGLLAFLTNPPKKPTLTPRPAPLHYLHCWFCMH